MLILLPPIGIDWLGSGYGISAGAIISGQGWNYNLYYNYKFEEKKSKILVFYKWFDTKLLKKNILFHS